jgi:hypothetical protein
MNLDYFQSRPQQQQDREQVLALAKELVKALVLEQDRVKEQALVKVRELGLVMAQAQALAEGLEQALAQDLELVLDQQQDQAEVQAEVQAEDPVSALVEAEALVEVLEPGQVAEIQYESSHWQPQQRP